MDGVSTSELHVMYILTLDSDQIFDKARIVNCALMAKIHTVEWTPAILAHPALKIGMNANWWGIVGEKLTKAVGRISKTSEAISGIPGSGVDHQGIPYSLTEEFVSVYRMHSLIPGKPACSIQLGRLHQTNNYQITSPSSAPSTGSTSTPSQPKV
jgi:hypothetical protein